MARQRILLTIRLSLCCMFLAAGRISWAQNSCQGFLDLSYPANPSPNTVGSIDRIRLSFGSGVILGGTELTVGQVFVDLNCNADSRPGECTPAGNALSYLGDSSILTTCPGAFSSNEPEGGGTVGELVFTASPAVTIPSYTSNACWLEFGVRVDSESNDRTPFFIEQRAGYASASCNTMPPLDASAVAVGGIAIEPTPPFSPNPLVYVSNTISRTVSVIDVAAHTVVDIPIPATPRKFAVSADGSLAYLAVRDPDGVMLVDLIARTVKEQQVADPTHSLDGPEAVALSPTEPVAYVTNSNAGTVSVIDTEMNEVSATVSVRSSPVGVAFSLPSGNAAYVTNFGSDTVSLIDTMNLNSMNLPVPAGSGPAGIAVAPSGKAYVANALNDTVSVIDPGLATIIATVNVGRSPAGITIADVPTRKAFAYVANFDDDSVSAIDTSTNTVSATVPVGTAPTAVAATLDGSLVYVANLNFKPGASASNGLVTAIDTTSNTQRSDMMFTVGQFPVAILVAPAPPPATPTPTPSATLTGTPTITATPSSTGTPTGTATPTTSPTITTTPTPPIFCTTDMDCPPGFTCSVPICVPPTPFPFTLTPTATPEATHTITPTKTASGTPSSTSTATPTSSATVTSTPIPTVIIGCILRGACNTDTPTPTSTLTPTPTPSLTRTRTVTATTTRTPTASASPTPTLTASWTFTATATPTWTRTRTATVSPTASHTRTPTPTPTPTPTAPPCVGDCNHDGMVSVDELLTGGGIVLGKSSFDTCPAFRANDSGGLTVDALIRAAVNAMNGCPHAQLAPVPHRRE